MIVTIYDSIILFLNRNHYLRPCNEVYEDFKIILITISETMNDC